MSADSKKMLDRLLLRTLELIEEIMDLRKLLNNNLQDGFLNLAKTRHNYGSSSISFYKINTSHIDPCLLVHSSEEVNDCDVSHFSFYTKEFSGTSTSFKENGVSNLRRRKVDDKQDSETETLTKAVEEFNLDEKAEKPTNPLHWFGVLTPQTLRASQKNFVEAIDYVAKLATLQSELVNVMETYKKLKASVP